MKKILIIDGDEGIRELCKAFLGVDYDILTAEEGQAVLDITKKTPDLDLILMGTDIPHLKGNEVCKRLRNEGYNIPIIGITGYYDNKEEWKEAGANDYLSKPFKLNAISKIIEKYTKTIDDYLNEGTWKFLTDATDFEVYENEDGRKLYHYYNDNQIRITGE